MEVLPSGGDKTVIADKVTAVKENKFRCRTLSANGIHETMIIRYDGADYHIKYIEEDFTDKKKSFSIITAERNRENINLVQLAELDNIYMGYSQKFLNKTGTTVTVTAGTLPDPNTETETYFHQMLYVFRGGAEMVRVIYGDGYTISGQVITFSNALRGENVLVHQYTEA